MKLTKQQIKTYNYMSKLDILKRNNIYISNDDLLKIHNLKLNINDEPNKKILKLIDTLFNSFHKNPEYIKYINSLRVID